MADLRVKVEAAALAAGIDKVRGALGKRDGIQSLTYILFSVGEEGLTLTAYNQAISARAKVAVPPDSFGGRTFGFCLDGRFANSMVNAAKGESFEFIFNEDDVQKQGANVSFYAKVHCGDAEWSALCIPESSYPMVPFQSASGWTVLRTDLLAALEKVAPMVTDIARSVGDEAQAQQANSFGLHWRDGYLEAGGYGQFGIAKINGLDEARFNFVLPPDGVKTLVGMLKLSAVDTLRFGVSEDGEATFQLGPDSLGIYTSQNYWLDLATKLEGPVEQTKKEVFAVDRVLLAGAIEQVQFLSEGEHGVRLQKQGSNLVIYGDDQIGQSGKVTLRVQWRDVGEYDVAFNWEFLKAIAKVYGSEQEKQIVFKEGKTSKGQRWLLVESPTLKTYVVPLRSVAGSNHTQVKVAVGA